MTAVDARLTHLIERARAADGNPPFSDGALAELALGTREVVWVQGPGGEGVAAAVRTVQVGAGAASAPAVGDGAASAIAEGAGAASALVVGAAAVGAAAAGAVVDGTTAAGAPGTPATEAEFVVDPDARRRGHGAALLDQLIADAPAELLVWAHGPHPGASHLAASRALEPVRELLHLRAEVGGAGAAPGVDVDGVAVPGVGAAGPVGAAAGAGGIEAPGGSDWVDELLAVNARAFAEHPEQGRMTRAEFDVLAAEPWYNASDVLLARDESGQLAGFCWLKVEATPEAELGEFYVVGVDPAQQGHGWGRRLVAAGMARLASRGIRTAHLYVEADNEPALALYRDFGFTESSRDVQYRYRA